MLSGRVLVAHNVMFDLAFLLAEYERLGHVVPITRRDAVCTMRLAGDHLEIRGRSLVDCCHAIGYTYKATHTAEADALAAARVLATLIRSTVALASGTRFAWPHIAPSHRDPVKRGVASA